MDTSIPQKQCTYCKQKKPATLDYFHHSPKGGFLQLTHVCKGCWKDYVTELARKRAGAYEGAMRQCTKCGNEFPATPKFFYREGAALRHECKQCRNKHRNRYYKANEERFKSNRKRRYTQDPQRFLVMTRNRTARIRANGGKHTAQDIQDQFKRQKSKCYYCHKKLGKSYHVDHIVPTIRGGTNDPDNLVVACHSCNESKRDSLLHEWPQGGRLL